MKPLYSRLARIMAAFSFLFIVNGSAKAQLVAGDIAFTGYIANGTTTDEFSFVVTVNIPPGTVINFTDNGWLSTNVFRAGEQTLTWTSPAFMIPAGREIRIAGPSNGAGTATLAGNGGTVGTVTGNVPSFATSGDQIIAYQGTAAAPTIIAAMHMNVYSTDLSQCGNTDVTNWDPTCITDNANFSRMPQGLTGGSTAIWIGTTGVGASEQDNAVFNCNSGAPLGTRAQVLAAVNNGANWITSSISPPTIAIPSGCAFMGLSALPVVLEEFTGRLNSDRSAALKWKVALQDQIREYIVEESIDAISFRTLGAVAANNDMVHTYNYTDMQVPVGRNYYRLKIVELDGSVSYSDVIMIELKAGIKTNVYPTVVKDKITVQQFGQLHARSATLSDNQGRVLVTVKLTSTDQTINMERYSKGIYFLKLDDGTVFKVIKE